MADSVLSPGRWGALLGVILVAGCAGRGSAPPPGARPVAERPVTPSPVQLQCERTASEVVEIRLRNQTPRPQTVELRFLAYAGRYGGAGGRSFLAPDGIWNLWYTQPAFRLAPSETWTARLHEMRTEKIEARDAGGRLLTSVNLMKTLPAQAPSATVAVDSHGTWRPFGATRPRTWRSVTPAALWPNFATRPALPVRILADVGVQAFRPEQIAELQRMVESGTTLVICGGDDLDRLKGWHRAGLLPLPVRGTRRLPGLVTTAARYGTPPVAGPLSVADIGQIAPPARVLLAEKGIPLIVAGHRGLGTLLFVTFDPTRPPFAGSRLERTFWKEWESWAEESVAHLSVQAEAAPAYQRVRRDLGLLPPSVWLVSGLSLAYLFVLALALVRARRRLRALAGVVVTGCAAALLLGPLIRGVTPVAAYAGVLALRSGDPRGRWQGGAEVMMPSGGVRTLRVAGGTLHMWKIAPCLQRLPSPHQTVQPLLRRWYPANAEVSAVTRLEGAVTFDVTIEGDKVFADVRNGTSYRLEAAYALWGKRATVSFGDLPPGTQARRLLARTGADGEVVANLTSLPTAFGDLHAYSNTPLNHPRPLLLANMPDAPLPELLVDERPVRAAGHTVLMVAPGEMRLSRPMVQPVEAVTTRALYVSGRRGGWWPFRGRAGEVRIEPGESALIELQLPPGSGKVAWRRLRLTLHGDLFWRGRVYVFDATIDKWVEIPWPRGHASLDLPRPERFLDRATDALRVRLENTGSLPWPARVQIAGWRRAQGAPPHSASGGDTR